MGENNRKWSNWQTTNLQNIQATPTAQLQKNKWFNPKIGQRTKQTFLQGRHTWASPGDTQNGMGTWVLGPYYQSQLVYPLGSTFPWSGRWEEGMVYNERSAQWSLFSFVCCQARSQPSSPVSLVLGVSGGVLLRGAVTTCKSPIPATFWGCVWHLPEELRAESILLCWPA